MKLGSRFWSVVLIGGFLLLAWCAVVSVVCMIVHAMPSAKERQQSYSLRCFVEGQVAFDSRSVLDSNRPPVYCNARRNSAVLTVYGATNAVRQEEVLVTVREWQTTNQNMQQLTVRFYERENWGHITNQDGVTSMRLPEVLLREVAVVLSKRQTSP